MTSNQRLLAESLRTPADQEVRMLRSAAARLRFSAPFSGVAHRGGDAAHALTRSLDGQWHGSYGLAPCPLCQPERRPDQHALSIRQGQSGRLLLHCHKSGCRFADLLEVLRSGGLVAGEPPGCRSNVVRRLATPPGPDEQVRRRERQAQAIWHEALPIRGTPAEVYLRGRAITCPLPTTLRYHPACWHASRQHLPALVARVEGPNGFAVHRTYLKADGSAKADVTPARAMLGVMAGGAVRLGVHEAQTDASRRRETRGDASDDVPLVVAEGIETALSLASGLLSHPARIWAALSANGLRGLQLPDRPGRLTVGADGDTAGRAAAEVLAARARDQGWKVKILPAPQERDWNDVLRLGRARHERA